MISFDKIMDQMPRMERFPAFDTEGEHKGVSLAGIEAIAYDGPDYKGEHTKIFAHIGFPDGGKEPMPAVVLVHGGGGHPEDIWIKKWNERGYAALSMDITGFFPTKPIPHLYEGFSEGLERRLAAPFAEEGYTVGPNNSEMRDAELPLEEQWMYHAVSAVLLAHNILRSDKRVDPQRIGICGISWGGVITSIAIGYDPRFAFAIPIYGSGYLGCGHSDLDGRFKRPSVQKWFAERRFDRVRMPVLWLCWNDDCCFSVNSNSMSYLETKENHPATCLSMLHGMGHSHRLGYRPEESYWFADAVLQGQPIPRVEAHYTAERVCYHCDGAVASVRLFYITAPLRYVTREKYGMKNSFMDADWQIAPLDPQKMEAELPAEAVGSYLEFTRPNGVVLTTPYHEK
ncbi:MAG: acetylxylan esterase [Clostridia bacterium]|nr:acetylxylan esterase [Clostridia bacterium]